MCFCLDASHGEPVCEEEGIGPKTEHEDDDNQLLCGDRGLGHTTHPWRREQGDGCARRDHQGGVGSRCLLHGGRGHHHPQGGHQGGWLGFLPITFYNDLQSTNWSHFMCLPQIQENKELILSFSWLSIDQRKIQYFVLWIGLLLVVFESYIFQDDHPSISEKRL